MKGWGKVICGILLIAFVFAIFYFQPGSYFSRRNVPVLVSVSEKTYFQASVTNDVKTLTKDAFTVLLLGIDTREGEESRSDAMMLAKVNFKDGMVKVISIPRDTRINIDGCGYTKINHAHLLGELKGGNNFGTKKSMEAVSNLFNCDINYYVKIDFEGFVDFIDFLGGIYIELPKPVLLTFSDKILPAGKQHIDGRIALELARERFSLPDGDFGRQKSQFLVLKAVLYQLMQPENMSNLSPLLTKFKQDVIDINLTDGDLISLAFMLKDLPKEQIQYLQVPGRHNYEMDPLLNKKVYYWIPDIEKIRAELN